MYDGIKVVKGAQASASHSFLDLLPLDPEDGGDTFLRNVGSHTDYMTI
jgi:hypothetical protein